MARLMSMPAGYFQRFVAEAVEGYWPDTVTSGRWSASEAEEKSRAELERFLPKGLETPGHHLCLVCSDESEEPVGTIWYGRMTWEGRQIAYVFDLRIYPEFRRRGYAEFALGEVERFAERRKLAAIWLHVFAHNAPALALYKKLGFTPEKGLMFKRLAHAV